MARSWALSLFQSVLLAALVLNCHCQERKVHVVYMGEHAKGNDVSYSSIHHTMLEDVMGSSSSAKEALVHSYGKSFNAFAAKLSDEEVARFSEMEGVVSVLPNSKLKLHTTRSWDFMGLNKYTGGSQEGDIIIGMLDTGVWPEAESFNDEGFGPPPAKWNGKCDKGDNFTCNNKLIGARFYNSEDSYEETDFKSARDSEGHGSHTASTAAGVVVQGASYYGLAEGTARGGVPGARIAVYKVCWTHGCGLADILAAFDDAISDGVDIISVSLGSDEPREYFEDPIAIGAFHAMRKGILTCNSAGNSGPIPNTVSNYSPWSMTVAASTIDRQFVANVVLGNGQTFLGTAINSFDLNGTTYPLIWGGNGANVSAGANAEIASYCLPGAMSSLKIKGKIVYCETVWDGSGVLIADGLGAIMTGLVDAAFSFPLPATIISPEDGAKLLDYIRTSENPVGTILVSEASKDVMAPIIASFSSRGRNPITPDILKPDITAPGVDILAAWSPVSPPSIYYRDPRSTDYNIISGTSMSCPHVSGAAAYVKAFHPTWSPAAIKSALMTTAYVMDPKKHEDLEFAYGSGHINPTRAVNPGLVFDADESDYVNFLCKQGYNTSTLRLVSSDSSVCNTTTPGNAWDLNYPSFTVAVPDGEQILATFHRTVTNVGFVNSTYYAIVNTPSPLRVSVVPSVLSFTELGQKKTFSVKVYGPKATQLPISSGSIFWSDGSHTVRTPLVVYTYVPLSSESYTSSSFSVPSKKTRFKRSSISHKKWVLGSN